MLLENELNQRVEELFVYYREHGFPDYDNNSYNHKLMFKKIVEFDENKIFNSQTLTFSKYPYFNGFLFSFFPHWKEVRCGTGKSVIENWNDDEQLKKLIKKTIIWEDKHNEKWSTNRIRQNAKVFCSGQSVSNFNPVVAKYLYNYFGNKGTVLDTSAGWGGRLFGFYGSNCKRYIGIEPSTQTVKGLNELIESYNKILNSSHAAKIWQGCSENFRGLKKEVDFAFTSPPYFDMEKYAEEDTQSYIKYPTRKEWSQDFLGATFFNINVALKEDGYMAINIANTSKYNWIEEDTLYYAKMNGFELIDTWYYGLSSISGKGNKKEPIFIFKKILG